MRVAVLIVSLLVASSAFAQIGPGEFAPPVGEDPSIGQDSESFIDDPPAGDVPSIGEEGESFPDDPPVGESPSVGGANEPFEQPGEGAPYGRLRPFD